MTTPPTPSGQGATRTLAFVAYPGLTALDLVGPLQVCTALADLVPDVTTVVVAERLEPMATDTPVSLVPSHTFDDVPEPHALIVPGGLVPTLAAMADQTLLRRIREAARHAQIVGSVCTGSLLLAAAGLLKGRQAATHWMYRHLLGKFGATPVSERWVVDGPFITAAGVSAGIDMALHLAETLAGEETARAVQLLLEYDPQPPLGAIDWADADTEAYKPFAAQALDQALAGHPDLLAHLNS